MFRLSLILFDLLLPPTVFLFRQDSYNQLVMICIACVVLMRVCYIFIFRPLLHKFKIDFDCSIRFEVCYVSSDFCLMLSDYFMEFILSCTFSSMDMRDILIKRASKVGYEGNSLNFGCSICNNFGDMCIAVKMFIFFCVAQMLHFNLRTRSPKAAQQTLPS